MRDGGRHPPHDFAAVATQSRRRSTQHAVRRVLENFQRVTRTGRPTSAARRLARWFWFFLGPRRGDDDVGTRTVGNAFRRPRLSVRYRAERIPEEARTLAEAGPKSALGRRRRGPQRRVACRAGPRRAVLRLLAPGGRQGARPRAPSRREARH